MVGSKQREQDPVGWDAWVPPSPSVAVSFPTANKSQCHELSLHGHPLHSSVWGQSEKASQNVLGEDEPQTLPTTLAGDPGPAQLSPQGRKG